MKGRLLSGIAAIALGLGLAVTAGPVQAFENVDWSWDKDKYQTVDINTWVWSFFHPEGETEVQKTQIFVGDVSAYASLKGDYVPQTLTVEGGTVDVPFSGQVTYSGTYGDYVDPTGQPFDGSGTVGVGGDVTSATVSGNVLEQYETVNFTVDVSGTVPYNIQGLVQDLAQPAVDGLGHAVQDVSAIGIADSIESGFPIYAHEVQVLLGGKDLNDLHHIHGDNMHEILGEVALKLLEKSDITATAEGGSWYNPLEIAIDQNVSAIAVAASLDLETDNAPALIQTVNANNTDLHVDTGDTITELASGGSCGDVCKNEYGVFYPVVTNNIIEADLTQFAYADVKASAKAYQDLTAFTNLGAYDRLGTAGLVANQKVSAAGLVASITNKVKAVTPTTP